VRFANINIIIYSYQEDFLERAPSSSVKSQQPQTVQFYSWSNAMQLIQNLKTLIAACIFIVNVGFILLHSSNAIASSQEIVPDLSMRGMIKIVRLSPEEFATSWDARRHDLGTKLSSQADSKEKLALQWQWASGLINYPFFHHRETGRAVPDDWAPRMAAIKSINFDDPSALASKEYIGLIDAWLHDQGSLLIKQHAEFRSGDNRWLRVKFSLLKKYMRNNELKRFFLQRELATHIDDNGARNLSEQIADLRNAGGDAQQLEKFNAAFDEENIEPKDHIARVYKTVDGVDLRVHLFQANKLNQDVPVQDVPVQDAPVLLWFHGGSLEQGHWSHCPVVCRTMQSLGFVSVQVEYRTSQRFDGTPLDALSDAIDALDWVISHAKELQFDPKKIMTAGFSSGATLATQLAVLYSNKVRAAVATSGCFDPAVDSWYNSVVSPIRDPKKLSPLRMLDANSPPMILFHDQGDKMCSYIGAVEFRDAMKKNQIDTNLESFDAGGHFFPFMAPASRERIKSGLSAFAKRLNWIP
jgi:acetyl esterase